MEHRILSLRVTEEEFLEIKRKAEESSMSRSNYIRKILFPEHFLNEIYIENIIDRIKKLDKNTIFELSDLFTKVEWKNYNNKYSISRYFISNVNKREDLKKLCKVIPHNKNYRTATKYIRL